MMKKFLPAILALLATLPVTLSCSNDAPPMCGAITQRDSMPVMVTYGVSKLISDSGVVKYKVIAEEWQYFDKTVPSRQTFPKGIFLERYDNSYKVDMYLTADTAYCYDNNLWELRGRVFVSEQAKGITYSSEELFWDVRAHRMYSRCPMHIITPDKDLRGDWFEANDQLTDYHVKQTSGYMPLPDEGDETTTVEEVTEEEAGTDTLPQREPARARRRTATP